MAGGWCLGGAWVKSSHPLAKGLPLELVVLHVMLAAWHKKTNCNILQCGRSWNHGKPNKILPSGDG